MTHVVIAQQEAYGALMDRILGAIRDRNEVVVSSLTDESDRILHAMQAAWPDVLARLETHPMGTDRAGEIRRLVQAIQGSLEKVGTTQRTLAQWGTELGNSLGALNRGRRALRGYGIASGRRPGAPSGGATKQGRHLY